MPYHVQFPGFGWEFDINPIAFSIGDYKVYWYGIISPADFCLPYFMRGKVLPVTRLTVQSLSTVFLQE